MQSPVARSPNPLAYADQGGEYVAPEVPPGPTSKEAHRAAKQRQSRFPSPVARRRRPVSNLAEMLKSVKISDAETGDTTDTTDTTNSLEAVKAAEELIAAKQVVDQQDAEQLAKLPLLRPGDVFDEFEGTAKGFRYEDGYSVSYNSSGQYRITVERSKPYDEDKTNAIVTRYPTGMAWMYWTFKTFGDESLSIQECLFRFGMGGWSRPNGMQGKVIFLDESKSMGRSFAIMLCKDGRNALSRKQEQEEGVFRIWRSCIPEELKDVIATGELINVRDGRTAPRWWEMSLQPDN